MNYVLYFFFIITGFYLILFGSRLKIVSNIILGFYLSYYLTLYGLILLDKFKPKDLNIQLVLFFLTIVLTFLFSLVRYITNHNQVLILSFSMSFTAIAFLNIFSLNIDVPDDIIILILIFALCLMLCLGIGFCNKKFITRYGYTFNGCILTPIHFAVLISELTALELCYNKNKN